MELYSTLFSEFPFEEVDIGIPRGTTAVEKIKPVRTPPRGGDTKSQQLTSKTQS
jgi:hypothetical protein